MYKHKQHSIQHTKPSMRNRDLRALKHLSIEPGFIKGIVNCLAIYSHNIVVLFYNKKKKI